MGAALKRLKPQEMEVVEQYLPMVKYLAQHVASRLPQQGFDLNDLIHAGILGLIEAVKRYDPSKGIRFESYARFRVKGAILDEVRAHDVLPRTWRQKAKSFEDVYMKLEQQLGRTPSEEEVARELGITLQQLHEDLRELSSLRVVSLEGIMGEEGEDRPLREILADPDQRDPLEILGLSELRDRLAEAIEELPEKHRLVITLYYYEELTMKEIAMVLGVTESRISQIHSEAILSLRAKLRRVLDDEGK